MGDEQLDAARLAAAAEAAPALVDAEAELLSIREKADEITREVEAARARLVQLDKRFTFLQGVIAARRDA